MYTGFLAYNSKSLTITIKELFGFCFVFAIHFVCISCPDFEEALDTSSVICYFYFSLGIGKLTRIFCIFGVFDCIEYCMCNKKQKKIDMQHDIQALRRIRRIFFFSSIRKQNRHTHTHIHELNQLFSFLCFIRFACLR